MHRLTSNLPSKRNGRALLINSMFFLLAADAVVADDIAAHEDLQQFKSVDTSRLMGSPTPIPKYEIEPAFSNLSFEFPVAMTHAGDGSDRIFVAGQNGVIWTFPNKANVGENEKKVFLDLQHKVARDYFEQGFFGVAFHPDYRNNRELFVYYTTVKPYKSVISRFRTAPDDPDRADVESEEMVLTINQPFWNHNSGTIRFGPDGYLYIPLGDGGDGNDPYGNGQNKQSLLGKILRIDVDKQDPGKNYAIPADNPFVNEGPHVRGEIWALGVRNPWTMMFDRVTGELWIGDVGQNHWEEVNVITRGGNYGWSLREGKHPLLPNSSPKAGDLIEPIWEYGRSEGLSITGGGVYRGNRLPELNGWYCCADFFSGTMWALRRREGEQVEVRKIAQSPFPVTSFGEDQQGELYFTAFDEFSPVTHGNTTTCGRVYRLRPASADAEEKIADKPEDFPLDLSETGLFTSVADHRLVPGIIPYDVNVPLWSDGAAKDRYLALPAKGQVVFNERGNWDFPVGTVLIKTFSLEMRSGDPRSERRLETRLLVHSPRGWDGYAYRWNEEQTEATLLDAAMEETFERVTDAGVIEQKWYYPSHFDCNACHTRQQNFVLGLNTRQLNHTHQAAGRQENQLDRLRRLEVFRESPTKPAQQMEAFPAWRQGLASTANLARAYLDANCAMCHQPGGNSVMGIDLRYHTALALTRMVNVKKLSVRELADWPVLVAPGNPDASVLIERINHRGPGQMPRLATNQVDTQAVKLLRRWIAEMEGN